MYVDKKRERAKPTSRSILKLKELINYIFINMNQEYIKIIIFLSINY